MQVPNSYFTPLPLQKLQFCLEYMRVLWTFNIKIGLMHTLRQAGRDQLTMIKEQCPRGLGKVLGFAKQDLRVFISHSLIFSQS
jgi:hypothetical protein